MKVVVTQSNYIPWKGYFDMLACADILVVYDDMQYTKRDWRNRNKIKTCTGSKWLSIPVEVKGKFNQRINETRIADSNWAKDHWLKITASYSKAPFFESLIGEEIRRLYETIHVDMLSEVNIHFLKGIMRLLEIDIQVRNSSEFELVGGRTERLVNICKDLGATEYISGPAAADYMELNVFAEEGVRVTYMDYSDYPVYDQLHGEFEHAVSIVDLLMMKGNDARLFMKH